MFAAKKQEKKKTKFGISANKQILCCLAPTQMRQLNTNILGSRARAVLAQRLRPTNCLHTRAKIANLMFISICLLEARACVIAALRAGVRARARARQTESLAKN